MFVITMQMVGCVVSDHIDEAALLLLVDAQTTEHLYAPVFVGKFGQMWHDKFFIIQFTLYYLHGLLNLIIRIIASQEYGLGFICCYIKKSNFDIPAVTPVQLSVNGTQSLSSLGFQFKDLKSIFLQEHKSQS